jgi:hypothetical protein
MNAEALNATTPECLNCGTVLVGPRCHTCGQPGKTARFTVKHLLHEIPHSVFHIDRGLLPTLYWLALRPGRIINEYLDGKRVRYFNPLTLLMIMAGVNTLLFSAFPLQLTSIAASMGSAADPQGLQSAMSLMYRYYALTMACMAPIVAFFSWLCFLGRGRYFGEHLTLQVFIAGFLSFFGICIYVLLRVSDGTRFETWVWAGYTIVQTAYYFYALAATFWQSGRVWSTLLRAAAFLITSQLVIGVLTNLAFTALATLQ